MNKEYTIDDIYLLDPESSCFPLLYYCSMFPLTVPTYHPLCSSCSGCLLQVTGAGTLLPLLLGTWSLRWHSSDLTEVYCCLRQS